SVPMLMPSLTPMVLKRIPTRSTAATPSLTLAARSSRCMLQELPSYQTLAMPTCALSMSVGCKPVAYNIAWDAPCAFGWVILELYLFSWVICVVSFLLHRDAQRRHRVSQRD